MTSLAASADAVDRPFANKGELARVLKMSIPTLNALIAEYPDFPIVARGDNGVAWQFDVAEVVRFLRARREAEQRAAEHKRELFDQLTLPIEGPTTPSADGSGPLTPAQRLSLARARRQERELALETGFLISTAELRPVLQGTMARLGRFLDTLPGQLGRQCGLGDDVIRVMRGSIEDQRRIFVRDMRAALEQEDGLGIG
jgi:phage terminase Nu1 subunit (DNA packaging protein)